MIDKLRHADRSRLALVGIGLAIVFFFALNLLADLGLTSMRLDLTEDRLFTLSKGTKETLAAIDEPIHIRFYYSERLDEVGPYFTRHAGRIEELLAEYQRLSDGMVRIERLEPEPFSHEEDLAVAEGLRGLPLGDEGTQAYFGLSGRNSTDDLEVISYLAPERGDFLEYDLTRLVYDLAHPEKPVVAVLGDLPLMGSPPRQQPWTVLDTMFQFFDVRFLGGSHDEIADEVDLLMLAQPQQLDEKSLYAIDQFVMRGGRVLALIDPFAEVMRAGGNPMAGQGNPVEVMAPLLEAWGIAMPSDQVVGDAMNAQRVRAPVQGREKVIQYLPWLTLDKAQLPEDDVITADLERITLATAGWIEPREGAAIDIEPLLSSSPEAAPIDVEKLEGRPDPAALLSDFAPGGEPFVLAARVSGPIESAFADGPPEGVDEEIAARHRAEPQAPLNLILIADADFLADRNWLREQNLLGQSFTVPIAHNGDFVVNALDNLSGSEALIGLRGRGLSVRPFEVIEAMEQEAEQQYRAKEEELLARIEETETKIRELQREEQTGGVILTAEQQDAIEDFRARMLTLRGELRDVQRSLREEPDRWITPERNGYRVASDMVRELVVQLADMRLIEPKTSKPGRYPRLEVADVEKKEAKSRLVRLADADGEVLAEAIFGKQRNRLTGVQPSGIYLRMPGDEQSWLASGGLEIKTEVTEWLDPLIMDVAGEEIRRIELAPAKADPYAVVRAAEGEEFTIEDLGEGEVLEEEPGFERLAGVLDGLELLDVRPHGEVEWPERAHRARFVTFDGLELTVHGAVLDEEQAWAWFEVATGDLDEDEAQEVRARAESIAGRTEGWAYQIPQYILDRLSRPKSEWLKQPDETS